MSPTSNSDVIFRLKIILANEGLRSAIVYLNSLTSYRFTSIYQFEGEILHNIIFYDRENPETPNCLDIPVLASYCVFVRDSQASFTIRNAPQDKRVDNHPKQKTIQSYCGVPLLDRDGSMFGTICHFDFKPNYITNAEVELLEYMSQLIKK